MDWDRIGSGFFEFLLPGTRPGTRVTALERPKKAPRSALQPTGTTLGPHRTTKSPQRGAKPRGEASWRLAPVAPRSRKPPKIRKNLARGHDEGGPGARGGMGVPARGCPSSPGAVIQGREASPRPPPRLRDAYLALEQPSYAIRSKNLT